MIQEKNKMRVGFNNNDALGFTSSKPKTNILSFINADRMTDSFISMARIDSGSKEAIAETQIPSTEGQKTMAQMLKIELEKLKLKDINVDNNFIVTATLEGNIGENSPVVGLIAHMDTTEDVPTGPVKPRIHDYNGGDIKLGSNTTISAKDLKNYVGHKIITSDGTTLLGADDKAGIAEILEAIKVFIEHPELKRPKIRIAFTPDEETGMGAEKFNIKDFGADVAYTVDGDLPHTIENESFNAFNPEIIIKGKNIHTGDAKGIMKNSIKVASWIVEKLPKSQSPETTEKRQGFYHIDEISGTVEKTKINLMVRDHDFKKAEKRIAFLEKIIERAREKFGCEIFFDQKERYRNMREKIDELPEVVNYAKAGIMRTGLKPKISFIRGGTDGSHLSINGLLTPNIGIGGQKIHSKEEFVAVSDMVKCTENILNIMIVWAENAAKVMPKILSRR